MHMKPIMLILIFNINEQLGTKCKYKSVDYLDLSYSESYLGNIETAHDVYRMLLIKCLTNGHSMKESASVVDQKFALQSSAQREVIVRSTIKNHIKTCIIRMASTQAIQNLNTCKKFLYFCNSILSTLDLNSQILPNDNNCTSREKKLFVNKINSRRRQFGLVSIDNSNKIYVSCAKQIVRELDLQGLDSITMRDFITGNALFKKQCLAWTKGKGNSGWVFNYIRGMSGSEFYNKRVLNLSFRSLDKAVRHLLFKYSGDSNERLVIINVSGTAILSYILTYCRKYNILGLDAGERLYEGLEKCWKFGNFSFSNISVMNIHIEFVVVRTNLNDDKSYIAQSLACEYINLYFPHIDLQKIACDSQKKVYDHIRNVLTSTNLKCVEFPGATDLDR